MEKFKDKKEAKKEYYKLLTNGYNQKEASAMVGISESTAGTWARQRIQSVLDLQVVKKNIIARLAIETANPLTPTNEIHNLASALSVIDRQICGAEKGQIS
jgi:hypothetical protein